LCQENRPLVSRRTVPLCHAGEVYLMAEFIQVVNYQTALEKIKEYFPRAQTEIIDLEKSLNRVLAEKIISPENLPAFNRSTVDGYAVRAEDTFGSSESMPAYLDFAGEIEMGYEPDIEIKPGECCWIPTGGMLPEGGNSAVMVEYTEKLGEDTILIYRPVGPWENVMQRGEDVTEGKMLFSKGKLLRPQDIGLLASLGIAKVRVYKPYKLGILSTGDEIIPVNKRPTIGQVRDINSYSLAAAVQSCGNAPITYPIIKDELDTLKSAVETAIQENDVVIVSGGSSVGVMDVTLDTLLSFNDSEMLFHGIAVKPGKPTMAVRIGSKLVIGLPGHPVSALMMFNIVCRPAMGVNTRLEVDARLPVNIASQAGRDDFIPVELINEDNDNQWTARPLLGKSGLMSILSRANAYIHISYEKQGLKKDEIVKAYVF